jgi:hypothetical protein
MEPRKESLEYWMGSIDTTLKEIDRKLTAASERFDEHERRLNVLEKFKTQILTIVAVVSAGVTFVVNWAIRTLF